MCRLVELTSWRLRLLWRQVLDGCVFFSVKNHRNTQKIKPTFIGLLWTIIIVFSLALVRSSLYSFLPFLSLSIHTSIFKPVLATSITWACIVASLAGSRAISALRTIRRLTVLISMVVKLTHSRLTCFASGVIAQLEAPFLERNRHRRITCNSNAFSTGSLVNFKRLGSFDLCAVG